MEYHKAIEGKTILIAEDEEINFLLMRRLLETQKAQILSAVNGKEAVEMCEQNSTIDLVLMDIKMPKLDGLQATRMIKETKPDLPIIALTAYALGGDRKRAMDAGCDDYIPKPVNKDDLFTVMAGFLETK